MIFRLFLDDPVKPGKLPIGSIHHLNDEVHCNAGFLAHLRLDDRKTPRVGVSDYFVDVEHHKDGAVGPHLVKCDKRAVTKEKKESPAEGPFLVICQKALKVNLSSHGLKGGGGFQVCQ